MNYPHHPAKHPLTNLSWTSSYLISDCKNDARAGWFVLLNVPPRDITPDTGQEVVSTNKSWTFGELHKCCDWHDQSREQLHQYFSILFNVSVSLLNVDYIWSCIYIYIYIGTYRHKHTTYIYIYIYIYIYK